MVQQDMDQLYSAAALESNGIKTDLQQVTTEQCKWRITQSDIQRATGETGDPAAGPCGIPYAASRHLGDLGVELLWEVAEVQPQGTNG